MTVHAPFRFAPIHRWVWFPKWGDLVSHDVPFKDGISGKIELEITAETPMLLGGPRRKPAEQRAGEVWPFETFDPKTGELRYALPGSALQGMIRSILEVAAFGRLGPWIDDQRFGIRDLSPPAAPFYRTRLVNRVCGGFLRKDGENWLLRPSKECIP